MSVLKIPEIYNIWKKHVKNQREHAETSILCAPQGPPADVWHQLHLPDGVQGGYLGRQANPVLQSKLTGQDLCASGGTKSFTKTIWKLQVAPSVKGGKATHQYVSFPKSGIYYICCAISTTYEEVHTFVPKKRPGPSPASGQFGA